MNPFIHENISDMEKIDRIYRMLRAEQRAHWIGRGIKVVLLGVAIFGYYYITDPTHAELRTQLTKSFQTQISAIVTPMVESMVGDMTQNMLGGGISTGGVSGAVQHRNVPRGQQNVPSNITPEMIRAVQEQMKKQQ